MSAVGLNAAIFSLAGSTATPVGEEHHRTPTAFYMSQRAATIAGGTPEIHRNNLARHYLHL